MSVIDIFDEYHNYVDVKLHWILLQPTTCIEYEYSQALGFALQYKHEYCSLLLSPLAVKCNFTSQHNCDVVKYVNYVHFCVYFVASN